MIVKVEIQRQRSSSEKPFIQTFSIDTGSMATVAVLLERINEEQSSDDPIGWDRSCKQQKCGACAMLINGRPRLACAARVYEYKKGRIKLAPLRKFPLIRDLIVDRSVMFDNLAKLGAWLGETAAKPGGQSSYDASKCLQCGCCLEVCPNFCPGGSFFGTSALAPAARLMSEAGDGDMKRLSDAYNDHFYRGCGKSLACRDICPAGLDTERMMINSNAAAVWKRRVKKP